MEMASRSRSPLDLVQTLLPDGMIIALYRLITTQSLQTQKEKVSVLYICRTLIHLLTRMLFVYAIFPRAKDALTSLSSLPALSIPDQQLRARSHQRRSTLPLHSHSPLGCPYR